MPTGSTTLSLTSSTRQQSSALQGWRKSQPLGNIGDCQKKSELFTQYDWVILVIFFSSKFKWSCQHEQQLPLCKSDSRRRHGEAWLLRLLWRRLWRINVGPREGKKELARTEFRHRCNVFLHLFPRTTSWEPWQSGSSAEVSARAASLTYPRSPPRSTSILSGSRSTWASTSPGWSWTTSWNKVSGTEFFFALSVKSLHACFGTTLHGCLVRVLYRACKKSWDYFRARFWMV